MGRKYYVISVQREYDGYETTIEYIGTNFKAACERYQKLFQYIKQRDFLDEGIAEDRIEANFRMPQAEMRPGDNNWSNLNDNDCYYISVVMHCITTNHFQSQFWEDRYKQETPNAKY